MSDSLSRRVACVCAVSCAALFTLHCASSPPPPDEQPPVEEPSAAQRAESPPPADPEPEAFCAEGTEEYARARYTWCVREGTPHGNFMAWYDDGTPRLEGAFAEGDLSGGWTAYYPDGAIKWTVEFVDNKEDGDLVTYYPSGQKRAVIPYVAGKRHGEAVYFDEQGRRTVVASYEEGAPAGEWTYWHGNGEVAHAYAHREDGKSTVHEHFKPTGETAKPRVGQMPRAEILPVLQPLQQQVVECYKDSRVIDSSSGKIVAQFTIGYHGEVSSVNIFESDFEHPFIDACLRRKIELLTFPANPYGPKTLIQDWTLSVE